MARRAQRSTMAEEVREFGQDMEGKLRETPTRLRRITDGRFDEATIPDAFRRVPKFISPRVHAWLDIAVTGYFLGLGGWCAIRGKAGGALAAFINAGMVAGVSLMTDYDGDGQKPINFKLHGTLDAVQAATAALAPVLHGFTDEPEAAFFYGQAANEVAVIAATDWDAGMPGRER